MGADVHHRGLSFSLRPQQITFVLPGSGYKQADLHHVEQEAESSMDSDLLEMAWEVLTHILILFD